MRQLRVGLAQLNVSVGDVEGNARRVLDAIEQARALGVDLVAFPELCLTGYAVDARASSTLKGPLSIISLRVFP